jgi:hypothetical protein
VTLAAASLGLLLAASEVMRWSAGVEVQTRGRDEPAGVQAGRAGLGELDLRGQLATSAQGADGSAALIYLPSLLLRQVVFGAPAESGNAARQGGRLELHTPLAPATRLASRTTFDWGLTDFSPLSGQGPPLIVGRLPSARFVRTLGLEMMFDLTHAFSRRLQLAVSAGMQRSGGVGHDAVQILPFQVGPQATASLAWAADRANALELRASASESRFSAIYAPTGSIARTSALSNLEASWTARVFRHTLLDAAAGLALVHVSGSDISSSAAYGSGALGVVWEMPDSLQGGSRASLRVRLVPGVDRLTALAIESVRAEGSAELTEGRLRLGVSGSEGHVIGGVGAGADELRLETRSSWTVAGGWSFEGGMGAARTNQLPFAGWQLQALLGLRWAERGWF